MRARLLAGPTALADYEIVEMLLFFAVPRRDTKPLAKSLVLRLGACGRCCRPRRTRCWTPGRRRG